MTLHRHSTGHMCAPPIYDDRNTSMRSIHPGDLYQCDECGQWWVCFFSARFEPSYLWKRTWLWLERLKGSKRNVELMRPAPAKGAGE